MSEKEEAAAATQFYVYECLDCQEWTYDMAAHTLENKHAQGYKGIRIPVAEVLTPEETEKRKEEASKSVKKAAAALVKGGIT